MSASIWNPGVAKKVAAGNGTITERFFLIEGQAVITLTLYTYTQGVDGLKVFLNGVLQVTGLDYIETSSESITLTTPAKSGDLVELLGIINLINIANTTISSVEVDLNIATTTNIGAVNSYFIRVVGSGAINSFGNIYKGPIFLRFSNAVTIVAGVSMLTPGGINMSLAANSTCIVTPKATNGTQDGWVIR